MMYSQFYEKLLLLNFIGDDNDENKNNLINENFNIKIQYFSSGKDIRCTIDSVQIIVDNVSIKSYCSRDKNFKDSELYDNMLSMLQSIIRKKKIKNLLNEK